jgi:MFS family permease
MVRKKEEIIINESDYLIHSKEKALKTSMVEGSMQSVALNMGGVFSTPYMLALGGNSFHVGLMSAASGLFSPLGQLKGSRLMEKYSRKRLLRFSKFITFLLYLPLIGLAYLFLKGMLIDYLPYSLILIWAVVLQYFWGIGHVSWFSWMGDIVPPKFRGKYFAKRNRVTGVVGLVAFLISAFILDIFKTKGFVLLGFTVLFSTSLIFRALSNYYTGKIFNPKFRVKKGYYFSFKDFVKRYDNFGKFAFFQAFFFFAIMLSAPFFAFHMLEDLGFSYLTFTAISVSSIVFYLLFTPLAGKFSDKYGNVKLLYVAAFLFPLIPIMWIFIQKPILLILIPGLFSGMANAAYILATTNFVYDSVAPQKRGLCSAYTTLLVGFGTVGGSFIGGLLIQYLNISFIRPIYFVFGLSALLIIMASLFFLPQLKDERKTDRVEGFSLEVGHPFKMIQSDVVWFKNFIHDKSY